MSSEELVRRIQRAYPLIWHHCHTHHRGRGDALSDRESNVLSHLSWDESRTPAQLARHLAIGASTLSEAIDKLVARGYVERRVEPADKRRVRYRLTTAGEEALDDASVLSSPRLRAALERLPPEDRERAVAGLELIAGACRGSGDEETSG